MQEKNYPLNQVKNISNLRQLIEFRAEESGKKRHFYIGTKEEQRKYRLHTKN